MNRIERSYQHPWPLKLVTWLVLGTQLVFPFQGQIFASSRVVTMPAASSFPAPVLTPKNVVVNRTVPDVQPPSTELRFSAVPTDAEISTAHVFKEPIVSVGRSLSPAENKDLASALTAFRNRQDSDDAGALENFLQAYPDSKWRISLLANLGSHYRQTMQFTKALAAWREMWVMGKDITDPDVKSIVDGAAAEMAHFLVTLGWADELQALLKELDGRPLQGAAFVWVDYARSALMQMQKRPERTFKCGPFALSRVCASLGLNNPANMRLIRHELAGTNGTSLTQNWLLSKRLGLNYQMAMRQRGAAIPLPCLVHWKQGHFSALTKMDNGRYCVEDGTFSQNWVTPKVLDEEASGYFLIPGGPLPAGWDAVTEEEGQNAWGRSNPRGPDPDTSGDCTPNSGGGGGGPPPPQKNTNKGMPQYTISLLRVSLIVADVPLSYTPPIGPEVDFRISYNELDPYKTGPFSYSNLGNQWSCEWISYVLDDTTTPNADVKVVLTDGGVHIYSGFNPSTQTYAVQEKSQGTMVKTSGTSYQVTYKDGSKAIFSQPDNTNGVRRVFLTQNIDPQGNALTFTNDSSSRLVAVTDAIGQVTALSYGSTNSSDSLFYKITRVTDPFGRYATFQYNSTNSSAQLTNITDEIGISSSLTYGNGGSEPDFINSFTTPYGTTTFTNGISSYGEYDNGRWLEATDPLGAKERVEFILGGGPDSVPANQIPTGMNTANMNSWLSYRTTYFWDQKAMEQYQPGDYSKATRYVWLMSAVNYETVGSILNAVIHPLENPVWYNYPGQSDGKTEGTINQPTAIARVLDDGSTQLYQYQYNAVGKPIQAIDPIGRTTLFTYATNLVDLLTVGQLAAGQTNLLARLTYNSQHLPLTYVDASGQTTYLGYNTNGQLTALTNALNQVITLTYDTNHYLTNISGALSYAPIDVSYDGFGRVRTVADSEGYSVTYDYDALDRLTKVTYPDGTYEQIAHKNLDPVLSRDRMGRWTAATYNAKRQLTAIEDALGRVTSFERCSCGALESITDPLGRTTTFLRDVEKRVTTKIYPDGTQLNYAYENTTSRLKSVTDAKNQTRAYSYYNDNNLKQVSYQNAVVATPSVSFTYDTNYNRLLTMIDGIGTTTYGYNPITTTPTLGAGQLASVDGPLANDTVTYSYDALGRRTSQAINGVAESVNYDALGRVTLVTNVLGSFTNVYVRATGLIATNLYPNGQQAVFSYYGTNGDERLQQIQNLAPNTQNLSTFGYIYDSNGEITNWTEQADNNTPTVQVEEYDPVNQLLSSTVHSGSIGGSVLKQFIYNYDAAGNRTSEQIQSSAGVSPAISSSSHNNLNQLTSRTGNSGPMRFRGTLDSTGTVTVAGSPATMTGHTNFVGYANVNTGTNVVPVVASDYSSHSRTNNFQVVVTNNGVAETLMFDLNGNETSVATTTGTNTYTWDAANRMVSFTGLTNQSLFTYDGLGRRVQDIELQNGVAVSTNKYVWCGMELCEQRDSTGAIATKRFFGEGEQISGTSYFFTRDHLGSVREMTDGVGTIQARYDYDPYGRRMKISGSLDADFGYAGMYYHAVSGLDLTYLRPYDADLGRWLSRDPLGETIGLNLYDYVLNNPINWFDPYGACPNQSIPQNGEKQGGPGGPQDATPILAKEYHDVTVNPIQGLINLWNNSTHSPLDPEYPGFDFKTGNDSNFIANGRYLNKAAMGNYVAGYGAQSYSNKYPMISPFMALAAMAGGVGLHLLNNLEAFSNKEFGFRFSPEQSEVGDWVDWSGIPDMAKGAWDALSCP
jgi:RHS repeat-associated protein